MDKENAKKKIEALSTEEKDFIREVLNVKPDSDLIQEVLNLTKRIEALEGQKEQPKKKGFLESIFGD